MVESREDVGYRVDVKNLKLGMFNGLFNELHAGTVVKGFSITSRSACGDGLASTADRIHIAVEYQNNPSSLPNTMVFKTLLLSPLLRFGLPAILSLSNVSSFLEKLPFIGQLASKGLFVLIGIFQKFCPQAPDAMYDIESRFYREVRPDLAIEAPKVFGARYDEQTRQFALLMEDLNLRNAHFPNAVEVQSLETVKSTLKQLAIMHARYWQSEAFTDELSWVPTRLSGGMFPVFDGIGFALTQYHVQDSEFKQKALKPLGLSLRELWQALWESQILLLDGPQTLLHGDTHVGNTYVLNDGSGGLLDFQLLVKGNCVIDVCYYLMTALDIEGRRRYEKELYHYYLQLLLDQGVEKVPSFDEVWHDHRLASIWGLVIGWLITPEANYGAEITNANVERLAQAVIDLDAIKALSEKPIRNSSYSI